jgi:hypothetical protein
MLYGKDRNWPIAATADSTTKHDAPAQIKTSKTYCGGTSPNRLTLPEPAMDFETLASP